MVRLLLYICIAAVSTSCIPLSFAPNIKTDKVKLAKRFKRDLPKRYGFIFEDPKEADDFYTFINTKYQLPGIGYQLLIGFVIQSVAFRLSPFFSVDFSRLKYALFFNSIYGFSHFVRALAKNSSFGFFSVGSCVGKKQMCCLCGWFQLASNLFISTYCIYLHYIFYD